MKISPNVDLGKSFDKLKNSLVLATQATNDNKPESYAKSFGKLETAVKQHLIDCTDITGEEIYKAIDSDPNDLKGINI